MATNNFPKRVTPKGVAIYPRLNTPDDKFNKAGQYKVKLAIDGDDEGLAKLREEVEALIDIKYDEVIAEITENLTKQGKKGLIKKTTEAVSKVSPFAAEEDDETGEETGRVLINAKMTASGTGKKGPWTRKPAIFSASGKKLANPPMIGSGSVLKLNVELFPYYAANDKTVGVSFRLEAAQVLTIVSGGARDAAGYGFGAEDGDDIDDMDVGNDAPFDTSGDDEDDGL